MDLKLEVVVLPVTDVDKAKEFYRTGVTLREDADWYAGCMVAEQAGDELRS
jgi:catechol 2,3-dioxygenase-like lactoylglutathione lyase family enzyme